MVVFCSFFFLIKCPRRDFLLHQRDNRGGKLFLKITQNCLASVDSYSMGTLEFDREWISQFPRARPLQHSLSLLMAMH